MMVLVLVISGEGFEGPLVPGPEVEDLGINAVFGCWGGLRSWKGYLMSEGWVS